MSFLDGDDLCADCGWCCHDVTALRMTPPELERLPLLAAHVTHREGPFALVDVPGPCPYLGEDRRCTVFDERPFDCSLFPLNVLSVGLRQPDGTVLARWHFGGGSCPERPALVEAAREESTAPLRDWVASATDVAPEQVLLEVTRRERARAAVTTWLHRAGLLRPLRRALRRAEPEPPPGLTPRRRR